MYSEIIRMRKSLVVDIPHASPWRTVAPSDFASQSDWQTIDSQRTRDVLIMKTIDSARQPSSLWRDFLEGHCITLAYQPAMNLGAGEIDHIEALARISHPQKGDIRIDEILDKINFQGLSENFDLFVVEMAIGELQKFDKMFNFNIAPMSINVTMESLRDVNFVVELGVIIDKNRICPSQIMIEVPMDLLSCDPLQARRTLKRADEIGVKLALDNFKPNFDTLEILEDIKIDRLKVAIPSPQHEHLSQQTYELLSEFAKTSPELASKVVMKNVEVLQIRDTLKSLDFQKQQGLFFKRPEQLVNVISWLEGEEEVRQLASLLDAPIWNRNVDRAYFELSEQI